MNLGCSHEWHFAVEPDGWPTLQSGWYVRCARCEKWAVQQAVWVDDFESPIGGPLMVPTVLGTLETLKVSRR